MLAARLVPEMKISRDQVFFGVCVIYVMLLVGCIGGLFTVPYVATLAVPRTAVGCYIVGDQLIFGATCEGFWGASVVETLLSLPLALFLLPFSTLATMSEAIDVVDVARFLRAASDFFVGLSLWAPLVYFVRVIHRVTLPPPRG